MIIEPVVLAFFGLNVLMLTIGLPCCFFPEVVPKICLEVFSYGKNSDTSKTSNLVKAILVPKRWFSHFYLFGVLYSGLVLSILSFHIFAVHSKTDNLLLISFVKFFTNRKMALVNPATGLLVMAMFFIHLMRRLYETLFINIFSDAKMNLTHYVAGLLHYSGAITSLLVYSVDQTEVAAEKHHARVNFDESCSILVLTLATLLFASASYGQYQSNLMLANLRKDKSEKENYPIPMGAMFDYVSCPHFFFEIIIYISLYIILGVNHYAWGLITSWVVLNQIMSAWMSHQWYLKNKRNYPKKRKAIIPFIL